ncbi:hypothetical protein L6452_13898 [Arctium lappa]|uniref:Uncharacterized protein n=1 Tax=Arctium lappa TaxID=4217 RepID=A0ACB9CJK5_ARCLA|nr:hypothetical protein L6452_13898 [Arctium lappa]
MGNLQLVCPSSVLDTRGPNDATDSFLKSRDFSGSAYAAMDVNEVAIVAPQGTEYERGMIRRITEDKLGSRVHKVRYLLYKFYDAFTKRIYELERQLADEQENDELLKAQ